MDDQEILLRAPPLDGGVDSALMMDNPAYRAQRDTLRNLGTLIQLRRDHAIFRQGEAADYIYFISSGVVRIFRSAENGRRQIISFRIGGDLCGLPQAGCYVNSAETVSATRIYRFPWKLFHQMILNAPQLQHLVLKKIAADFRHAQSRIIMLGQENIVQRMATFLVSMMTIPQFYDPAESLLYLPMNRFDVADYLGTCAETAGRVLTKLEDMGMIRRLTPRCIRIIDANRLRNLQRGPRRGENRADSARAGIAGGQEVRGDASSGNECIVPP